MTYPCYALTTPPPPRGEGEGGGIAAKKTRDRNSMLRETQRAVSRATDYSGQPLWQDLTDPWASKEDI